uniref:PepSY domain-containing protein n=1 Tax=Bosea sp. NBC_00436 TaxID=2969620 RepID=A0A9E8CRV9_9HYPH
MLIPSPSRRLLAALALNVLVAAAAHGEETYAYATISEQRARDIAWSAGLVHIEEIIRAGDRWEVAGRTAEDDEMSLDIDIKNGRILD